MRSSACIIQIYIVLDIGLNTSHSCEYGNHNFISEGGVVVHAPPSEITSKIRPDHGMRRVLKGASFYLGGGYYIWRDISFFDLKNP